MNKIRNLIATNITYFRYKNKWSQEILAEKMNSSPSYISQLENGKRNITSNFIDKLVEIFDIEPVELFKNREFEFKKRVDKTK